MFFIVVASFAEIIVFNEEVLLCLCFFSFCFVFYNTQGDTIFSIMEDRSNSVEIDALVSIHSVGSALKAEANELNILKTVYAGLLLVDACIRFNNKISFLLNNTLSRQTSITSQTSLKLTECFMTEHRAKRAVQNKLLQTMVSSL